MPRLVIEKGPNKGETLNLTQHKGTVLIGRETTAHLKLADTMSSRLHFKIEARPDGFYVVDMDSMNGTFVNGNKVQEHHLKPGDTIQIGETIISFTEEREDRKDSRAGEIIGGYKIIERIGKGGMGTVYKANQLSLNRIVALKLLSQEMVKDKSFVDLFIKEARASAQLNHPNIVQIYDVSKTASDIYYFSMEYLPKGSVQELIAKKKKLDPLEATRIILDAARGLEFAEMKGIVHRDIKPDNLMVAENDTVKIGDLGLAKSIKTDKKEEGGLLGTPHYIAPEQAQGKPVDTRADIYSLGSTFYRILTGATPYSGASIKEIISSKLKHDPKPIKEVLPTVPDAIVPVVTKMMKRNPDERYKTATELIAELKTLRDNLDPSKAVKAAAPAPKPAVSGLVIRVAVVVAVLVAAALLVKHFSAKPDTGGTGTNTGGGTIEANPLEEKLAQQYYSDAQNYERSHLKTDSIESIARIMGLYERILKECPRSTLAPQAERDISRLTELKEQVENKAQILLKEKEATQAYETVNKTIDDTYREILRNNDVARISNFIEGAISSLNGVAGSYPDSKAAQTAAKKKEELSQWYNRFQQSATKYEDFKNQIDSLIQKKQFDMALALADGFIKNPAFQNTIYDNVMQVATGLIKNEAEKSFSAVAARADDLIKEDNLGDAKEVLTAASGSYGIPQIENSIKDKIKKIDDLIAAKEKAKLEQMKQLDEGRFQSALIGGLWLVQSGKFNECRSLLKETARVLQTPEYQQQWKDTTATIELELNILEEFRSRVARGTLTSRLLRGKYILSADTRGIITSIDATSGSSGTITFKWEEIPAAELYTVIIQGWNLTKQNYLELGVLALKRGNLTKEARTCFDKATEEPTIEPVVTKYRQQSKEEKKTRDNDSRKIYTQANNAFNSNNYQTALEGFYLLKYRYSDTKTYKDNDTDIRAKINQCEKMLK